MKLDNAIRIKARFGRSVNLERDFYYPGPLDGYVLTTTAQKALTRILDSCDVENAHRAWTLTGPYGSGKSAFALFCAKVLNADKAHSCVVQDLLRQQDQALHARIFSADADSAQRNLFPILVSGTREPISRSILRGIKTAVRASGKSGLSVLLRDVDRLGTASQVGGAEILELLGKALKILRKKNRKIGLLLIIDELGKLLEFVAGSPDKSDIFLLQELAEATRTVEPSFVLLTVLHQAFERYAERLGTRERNEWTKVQGRFEDLAFQEPNEQVLFILQSAFAKDGSKRDLVVLRQQGEELGRQAFELRLCGTLRQADAVKVLSDCMPLHPTVALALGNIFKKFGQNERSLFAFLTSSETYGLADFLTTTEWTKDERETLRLDRVYDYLTSAMGNALYAGTSSRKWAEVEGALNRLNDSPELTRRLLKVIGLLQLIGDIGNLKSSIDVLRFALAGDDVRESDVDESLRYLTDKSVVIERRFNNTFAIWEGSDINLDERFLAAASSIDPDSSLAESLQKMFPARPLVAKRHSDETGTLRFYESVFVDGPNIGSVLNSDTASSDGKIVYALTKNSEELAAVQKYVAQTDISSATLIAIPKNLEGLREAINVVACWEWVHQNTPELENDRVARTELAARLNYAQQTVTAWLDDLQANIKSETCPWFWRKQEVTLSKPRSLQELLSRVFDEVFHATPKLRNELINRRVLSSAATAARKLLFESMVAGSTLERLGIVGYPPQLSMYFSLLERTTIHRTKDGKWGFFPPTSSADPGIRKVWEKTEQFLDSTAAKRESVSTLYALLQDAPFGLKSGVLPIFFASVLLAFESEVALYERDSFVPKLTVPVFERLCKSPDQFAVQLCRMGRVRTEVIEKLASTLLNESNQKVDVLSVVRPLLMFANGLDEYTRYTARVSSDAQNVRTAMLTAREPHPLLFDKLPRAVGLAPVDGDHPYTALGVEQLCEKLRKSLSELRRASENLLFEVEQMLIDGFELSGRGEAIRAELRERTALVEEYAVSAILKSFILRVRDEGLEFRPWLESIGSLIVGKPLSHWHDSDLSRYELGLAEVVRSFTTMERLAFEIKAKKRPGVDETGDFLRMSVTRLGEAELERVFAVEESNETLISLIEEAIEAEFKKFGLNGNLEKRLNALASLSWKLMQKANAKRAS